MALALRSHKNEDTSKRRQRPGEDRAQDLQAQLARAPQSRPTVHDGQLSMGKVEMLRRQEPAIASEERLMDFPDVVRRRRSVRKYRAESIDSETLARILDTGTRGPSAGYSQGQSYVVVTDLEMKRDLDLEMERQITTLTGTAAGESLSLIHI